LEDFYDFCQTLGDTTAEVMSEALAVSYSVVLLINTRIHGAIVYAAIGLVQ